MRKRRCISHLHFEFESRVSPHSAQALITRRLVANRRAACRYRYSVLCVCRVCLCLCTCATTTTTSNERADQRLQVAHRHSAPRPQAVLGGARQRHVSVTGDTVNAASRLQDVAKTEGMRVVVSDTLLQATEAPRGWIDRLRLTEMGLRPLRGRAAHLHVWAGQGPLAEEEADPAARSSGRVL